MGEFIVDADKLKYISQEFQVELNSVNSVYEIFDKVISKVKTQYLAHIIRCEVLLSISKDEIERARLMSEYKYAVDTQSKVVQAKREGIQEEIQEEMERGYGKQPGI
jgi:hypothetical protein